MRREEIKSIPAEADRCLQIWAEYKNREGGVVTLGYPKRAACFFSGGASTEDSCGELEDWADRRTGAIADKILDDMSEKGLTLQVMAIWSHYYVDVFHINRNPYETLIDGCINFLIEAKRKGIAL